MFYFWRSGENGELWLSGEGIRDAFTQKHPEGPVCSEVALLGESNLLNVSFILDKNTDSASKIDAEKKFLLFAGDLGIDDVQTVWVRHASSDEFFPSKSIHRSPFFWGGLAWIVFAAFNMGIFNTLLTTTVAVAGFCTAALFTTTQGAEVQRWFKGLFRKNDKQKG